MFRRCRANQLAGLLIFFASVFSIQTHASPSEYRQIRTWMVSEFGEPEVEVPSNDCEIQLTKAYHQDSVQLIVKKGRSRLHFTVNPAYQFEVRRLDSVFDVGVVSQECEEEGCDDSFVSSKLYVDSTSLEITNTEAYTRKEKTLTCKF